MNQLRLDQVLARDAAVQWFEGVAVVQLICRALRAQGGDDSTFPAAAEVVLAPGGSIGITGASQRNAVSTAAHLLARMLSDDVPVRLRLAVSQATATESANASLAEFSQQLAYFERPNPEAIVEGLRQRALLAAPRAEVAASLPRVETPAREERRPASSPAAAPRRVSRLAVMAAAVSAVACASVWVIGRVQMRGVASAAPVAERPEPPASNPTQRAPGARHVTRGSAAAPVSFAGPTKIQAIRTSGVATAEDESTPGVPVSAQLVSYSYLQPIGPVVDVTPPRLLTEFSTPDPRASADSFEEDSDRIYTRNDPNVTLPLNVYPKFSTPSATSNASTQAVLELTIARDGLVEQVKMLTPPRNIHEFMLLSAAKAWRFEPARIQGRAIRFRHLISMDAASVGWNGSK